MFGHWRRSPLKWARRAARSKRWDAAAISYREHLDIHPADGAAWVQLGHCFKEQNKLHAASAAYRRATEMTPEREDGWIQFALITRRLETREAAIMALERGLVSNPGAAGLIAEMLALGARDRLPMAVQAVIEEQEGFYSLRRYDVYRATRQKEGKENASVRSGILPVIDARGATPEMVLLTREYLAGADCLVLTGGSGPIIGVPLIFEDRGIDNLEAAVTHLLLIEAGSRVDHDIIERLRGATDRTGALAAYCDHDHWELTEAGSVFGDPCFQPMLDPIWFKRAEVRPPCMIVDREVVRPGMRWGDLFSNRMSLPATYVHVPLVLASRRVGAIPSAPVVPSPHSPAEGDIQVIIQTRDEPEMLERCVTSLLRTATRPDRIDIVIMDNRSLLPETADLLAGWTAQGIARSIPHDEPFNWARANNVAARLGQAPYLLFLNNDVEMESRGWDVSLRDYLAEDGAGAIGALLLYPDRLIQHGGVVLGMGTGGPAHEGVGHRFFDYGGPSERWKQPRLASAVTGAWLGTTRHLFNMVGGFEERLAVAYNDIDFCLRCRAANHLVIQASDIIAIHRESATRGIELSPVEHAREQAENAWFRARWGRALDIDPAYNPHWVRTGQPFDGFGAPSEEALTRWIEASARPRPWSI